MGAKHRKNYYRKSASKGHKLVGDYLRTNVLTKSFRIYQEYPIPGNTKYHVDYFIQELSIVVEIHGEQHLKPVAFDGKKEGAKLAFLKQRERDRKKEELIKQAGWELVIIWYDELNNLDLLFERILKKVNKHDP